MALRTLDSEETDYLYKKIQELNVLHGKVCGNNSKAYNYDWMQLSAKLHDVIGLYKYILEKNAEYEAETSAG